jgi:N-acetylglucosamine-6-phosphate deacetylase
VFALQGRRMTRTGTRLISEDGALAGSAITLRDAVRHVVETLGLPLADALRMATSTPARLLRLDNRIGRLAPGLRADLVHLSDDLDLAGVWIGGRKEREAER